MVKSILLVGVGGQGTILTSKILTLGLLEAGNDVRMNEIHGMSQRGGSVSSQIRYAPEGEEVQSPVIEENSADMLVSFEKMEALRWISWLKDDGLLVVNDCEIPPLAVLTGKTEYPQGIDAELSKRTAVMKVEASKRAIELGNPKAMNMILLGVIVKKMGLEAIDWMELIRRNVRPNFVDINIRAFQNGLEML